MSPETSGSRESGLTGALGTLRELAKKATPGPWHHEEGSFEYVIRPETTEFKEPLLSLGGRDRDDALFIAACDPDTISFLLDIAEAAKEDAEAAGCLEPVPDEVGSRDENGVYHDTYSDCGHCTTCRIRQALGAIEWYHARAVSA